MTNDHPQLSHELNRRNAERHGASDKVLPRLGACILTAENIATEDDCTTHDHETL